MSYEYKTKLLPESYEIISSLLLMQAHITATCCCDISNKNKHQRKISNDFFISQSGKKDEVHNVDDFFINNTVDDYKIPVRLYDIGGNKKDVIVFAHGGGWIQGNLETHDCLCRKMANILHKNVLAVDYRLSPESVFPTQLNDVLSAYLWASENYSNVYLSGDSAGGNLCLATCLKIEKINHEHKPKALLLFYPITGADFQTVSCTKFGHFASLSYFSLLYCFSQYNNCAYNQFSKISDKFISPILEDDMSIFPKTMIVSAGCDVLLSYQLDFKEKMCLSNNCEQIILDGAIHGFMTYGNKFDKHNTRVLNDVSNWLNK